MAIHATTSKAQTGSDIAMGSVSLPESIMADTYVLRQAKSREEMDRIMEVIWAANYTPYEPLAQLFFPVLGFTQAHREASMLESKERFWKNNHSNPESHWFYAEEIATGKVVGCAQWMILKSNPFAEGVPSLRAPWWPEGEHRDFCELILNQIYKPRASWMRRPHLALNWMAVHPLYRRRGIGSLLMDAGISRADTLQVECWMEASSMGKPLYEKSGFRSLLKIAFDTEKKNASDVWRKCEHEMTPEPIFAMWRPKQGIWETRNEGDEENGAIKEVKMPWDLGAQ